MMRARKITPWKRSQWIFTVSKKSGRVQVRRGPGVGISLFAKGDRGYEWALSMAKQQAEAKG